MTEVLERMLGDVKFVIERTTERDGVVEVTVKAPAAALRALQGVPDFVLEQEARFTRWVALDDQGREVAKDYNLAILQKWGLRSYFKELGEEQCRKQLETLRKQGASLRLQDFSTGRFLELFEEARKAIGRLWYDSSTDAAVAALRAVERHLERIETEPHRVLLEDILSGAVAHRHHYMNTVLLKEIETLSVRSGGRIEMPADDMLEELYELALGDTSKVAVAQRIDLELAREMFVSKGQREDSVIDWAPETFEYEDGRRSGSFAISYGRGERDGKTVPMASLTIPLSLYANKRVELPKLPHGIQLHLSLTVEGKTAVMAFVDQAADRVKKYKGGQRRGRQQTGTAFEVEAPTEVPPWAKGKSAHVRRR